jgi:subtilase family serine protease
MRKAFHVPALAMIAVAAIFAGCAGGGAGSLTPAASSGHSLMALNQSRALPAESPTPTPTPTAAPQGGLLGGLLGGVVGIVGGVLNLVGCVASLSNAGCHVSQNTNVGATSSYVNGLGAADIWSAYNLAKPSFGSAANGRLIAVVSAYHAPNAQSDLAAYRKAFGMPACTTSNGCFKVIDQAAGTNTSAPAWAMETDIDLAMASVGCPTCRLVLIEAASSDIAALAAAEDTAASLHPAAISNSFGVPESASSSALGSHWNHPGIAIVASSGDGKSATFPATLPSVTAVGGTVLAKDASVARGWSESAWSNSGAGCSTLEAKPDWQTDAYGCANRAVADVSAVAAANPGVAVYDHGAGGWIVVTGTSVATPLIAGLYAAAGDYPSTATGAPGIYAKASALHSLPGAFSQGTPNGLAAF